MRNCALFAFKLLDIVHLGISKLMKNCIVKHLLLEEPKTRRVRMVASVFVRIQVPALRGCNLFVSTAECNREFP